MVLLIGSIVFLAIGAAVMFLWNNILPELIHVSRIDYPHALGLFLLCRILFGRMGAGGPWNRGRQRPFWKQRMNNMSEEDRIRFREEWKRRCSQRDTKQPD